MTASETIPKTRTRSHHIADWDPEDVPAWLAGGNKIARRNLIWSVLAEHIGFSVWSDLAELLAEKVRIVESKVKSGAANPAPKLATLIASPELSVSRFGVVPTVTRLRKLPKCTETGQLSAREISRAPGAFGNSLT